MRRRLPKTFKEIDALLLAADCKGYNRGRQDAEYQLKQKGLEIAERQKNLHLDALKAATALASATGQHIESLARIVQSEKGQL